MPDTSTAMLALCAALAGAGAAQAQQPPDHSAYILDLAPTVLDLVPTVLDQQAQSSNTTAGGSDLSASIQEAVDRSEGLSMRQQGNDTVLSVASDVLFAFDSAELSGTAQKALTEVAGIITKTAGDRVRVVGYTDSKGSDDYNLDLSKKRAEAVANWLTANGVAREHLTLEGLGESQPVAANETPDGKDNPDGRAQNRRVEFVFPGAKAAN